MIAYCFLTITLFLFYNVNESISIGGEQMSIYDEISEHYKKNANAQMEKARELVKKNGERSEEELMAFKKITKRTVRKVTEKINFYLEEEMEQLQEEGFTKEEANFVISNIRESFMEPSRIFEKSEEKALQKKVN